MTRPICSRLWQVAASRDGRLSGKDLDLAERHREHCSECAEEARKLSELTQGMKGLPELPRDPLSVRRSRQRLMSAVNDSLLASPPKRSPRWVVALALLPAAALGLVWLARHAPPNAVPEAPKSAVEVRGKPGAHWVVRSSAALEQVDFQDGEASFQVHPHADRRVLVRLPDGELEDLGTTFEVAVHDLHTSHIAVSEGRVAVRLSNRPEFALSAGQHWELAPSAPAASASATEALVSSANASAAQHSDAPVVSSTSHRMPSKTVAPVAAPSAAASAKLDSDSTRAEDAAYLAVVALLHQGRTAQAREQAKAYLLRFPSGFRRIEMLNVATSDAPP